MATSESARVITVDEVNSVLDLVVAEFGPGFVYTNPHLTGTFAYRLNEKCLYVHRDEDGQRIPGCIVAQVMFRLGFSLDLLGCCEGESAEGVVNHLTRSNPDVRFDPGVSLLLCDIQLRQDEGVPWGEAVKKGRALMTSLAAAAAAIPAVGIY